MLRVNVASKCPVYTLCGTAARPPSCSCGRRRLWRWGPSPTPVPKSPRGAEGFHRVWNFSRAWIAVQQFGPRCESGPPKVLNSSSRPFQRHVVFSFFRLHGSPTRQKIGQLLHILGLGNFERKGHGCLLFGCYVAHMFDCCQSESKRGCVDLLSRGPTFLPGPSTGSAFPDLEPPASLSVS